MNIQSAKPVSSTMKDAFWIWGTKPCEERNVFMWFRADLALSKKPDHGSLSIGADLRYAVWINETLVGFGPPKYHLSTPTIDLYDVTSLLQAGHNTIAVQVYSMGQGKVSFAMPWRGALIAKLDADGQSLSTDAQWKAHEDTGYIRAAALGRGEFQPPNTLFDGRLAVGQPWLRAYDDQDWPNAVELSGLIFPPWTSPEYRDIPLIPWRAREPLECIESGQALYNEKVVDHDIRTAGLAIKDARRRGGQNGCVKTVFGEYGSPNRIILDAESLPPDTGCYALFDLGAVLTGYPLLRVSGSQGAIIDLSTAEHLTAGTVNPMKTLPMFDRIILGDSPLSHRIIWPKCCRYLQVDVRRGNVTLESIALEESHYPLARRGHFHSSDPLLAQAYEISARTVALCMEDSYMDTPWRERGSWLGDIVPEAHGNYFAYGDLALIRRFLLHHSRGQNPDGDLNGKYPGNVSSHISTWNLTFALTLYHYLQYSGDMDFARTVWPTIAGVDRWLEQYRTAEGLYGNLPLEVTAEVNVYNFIDWSAINTRGCNAAFNAFAYACIKQSASIAQIIGDAQAAEKYGRRADDLRHAFQKHFWSEANGTFVNGVVNGAQLARWGVHENMLAVLWGMASPAQARSIMERLMANDLNRYFVATKEGVGGHPAFGVAIALSEYLWDDRVMVPVGTPYFAYYYLQGLCETGLIGQALDFIRLHWGNYLKAGATTVWETWSQGGSLSHAWGCAPIIILTRYIAGIDLNLAHGNQLSILPFHADLTEARCRMASPQGDIDVEWTFDGKWRMTVSIPDGLTATVGFPKEECPEIYIDGILRQSSILQAHGTDYRSARCGAGIHQIY